MRGGRIVVAVVAVGLLLGSAGCTTVTPGVARAADPVAAAPSGSSGPTPTGPGSGTTGTAPPGPRSSLASDVVDDECLLDALGFTDLLGVAVLPPRQQPVTRSDGSVSTACYAASARGFADPLAAINVYEPRSGTPAEFVRGGSPAGRRELTGVGEAAVLVDTAPGVTLQVAGSRYLVTIAVLDGSPPDDAWRTAATAALAALPA